jgi:flagellar hook-length control protein FliK
MTIDNTGNSMKVHIMTENPAARDLLTSSVNELRSVLSNSGVTLEQFDVDMNSDFRKSMADTGNQAGNFGKRYQNRKKLDGLNGEGMNGPPGLIDAFSQDGALHFVA